MTCAELTNALNNTLLDTDDFARQIKSLCGSTSVDSKPTPELHVIKELLPSSMEETHKEMYEQESFTYVDAVKRGVIIVKRKSIHMVSFLKSSMLKCIFLDLCQLMFIPTIYAQI